MTQEEIDERINLYRDCKISDHHVPIRDQEPKEGYFTIVLHRNGDTVIVLTYDSREVAFQVEQFFQPFASGPKEK